MWCLPVIGYILAAIVFSGIGYPIQFWVSLSAAVITFCTWRIIHKRTMDSATGRYMKLWENMQLEGRPPEEIANFEQSPILPTSDDMKTDVVLLTIMYMILFLAGFVMLAWGISVRFF